MEQISGLCVMTVVWRALWRVGQAPGPGRVKLSRDKVDRLHALAEHATWHALH